MPKAVYAGGPCPCAPGRYVRFAVPDAPGCDAVISCRGNASAKDDVREHPIPSGAALFVRLPGVAR